MAKYTKDPIGPANSYAYRRKPGMHSQRRLKVIGLLLLICAAYYFWPRSAPGGGAVDEFYSKTVHALDKEPETQVVGLGAKGAIKDIDDDEALAERLKEAAQAAKEKANAKSPRPDPPSSLVGVGSAADGGAYQEKSVAGRKKYTPSNSEAEAQEPVKEETDEEHQIETELNSILKKSPIIIFSKSYCPHSRNAKDILLGKYDIEPAPFVVELDQHPIGSGLQARLAELTGRKTVPNVLINGVSIGGGDDVIALHGSKALIDKIKTLGGKRMTLVQEHKA